MRPILPLLISSFFLIPGIVHAGLRQFTPKIVNYIGSIEVAGLYEEDNNDSSNANSNNSYSTKETTLQQFLNVSAQGYIYSPLFITFNTSVGGGLQEEDVDENGDRYQTIDYATKYKAQLKILPTHPYHLDIYALRETPIVGGRRANRGSVVIYEYGVLAQYLLRPWNGRVSYTNHRYEGSSTSRYDDYQLDLTYFQDDVNASTGYTRNNSDGYNNNTVRDLYYVNVGRQFNHLQINGRWDKDKQDQQYDADKNQKSDSDYLRETWFGEIRAELPKNFKSTFSYQKNDNIYHYQQHESKTTSSNTNDNYNLFLSHRLFNSLATSVNSHYMTNKSNGGESEQKSIQGSSNYVKKIPWGKFFFGLLAGRSDFDNTGAVNNLFERHGISSTGSSSDQPYTFTLNFRNVDENSIQVSLIDHHNNNLLIKLIEGIHYLPPVPYDNTYRIRIISLPPGLADPIEYLEDYQYQADYAFIPADYTMRTDNWGYSTSISFFDDLLTPHYNYNRIDQKVTAGIYPGETNSSTTHAVGFSFNYFPFRGDVTQSRYRSNTRDEDRLTAYLNYIKNFTAFTEGRLNLTYEDIDSTDYNYGIAQPDISEKMYSIQAQLLTNIPTKSLTASLNSVYSFYNGVGDTASWSIFSTLNWHIGRMDLNITANYSNSESTTGNSSTNTEYTTIRFYIKREIF